MRTRVGARLVLLNTSNEVFLFHFELPQASPFWATPGGGPEESESLQDALGREALEELGLSLDSPLPHIWVWHKELQWGSERVHFVDHFFLLSVRELKLHGSTTATLRQEGIVADKWWSLAEIEKSTETIYPETLAPSLRRLLLEGAPSTTIDISARSQTGR